MNPEKRDLGGFGSKGSNPNQQKGPMVRTQGGYLPGENGGHNG